MIVLLLPPANPMSRWTTLPDVGVLSAILFATPALISAAENAGPTAEPALVYFAFSKSLFAEVNENDAKAAVKAYTQIIADQNGVSTGGGPLVLDGTNAMAQALRLKQVDLLSVTAEEFLALEAHGLEGPLLMTTIKQSFTEEYLLLARQDSPIQKVADLKGLSLIVSSDVRASLARTWLEVLCQEQGLGPADQVFAKVTPGSKPTQVVLPVFFGKTDACLATRNGWDVMGELNPQVKKQLRVVASSPPVVPAMTCFRRGLSEEVKGRIITAAMNSQTKVAFKQLMALFKTDSLDHQPLSALESTRKLVATHRKLCAGVNQSTSAAPVTEARPSATEGEGR
jgi:phosphonate transport system substrate-binding protein